MRKLKSFTLTALLCLAPLAAQASKTCIFIGDSILSAVPQGKARHLATHLITAESDVVVKNLASPGASLGSADFTGFNSGRTEQAIDLIRGAWNAYDCVTVQAGTNDFSRNIPWQSSVEGLRRVLSKVRADGKKAIVMPMVWRADADVPNAGGLTLGAYSYLMALVCAGEYPDICHFGKIQNTPLSTGEGALTDYDTTETTQGKQLHLNAVGQRKWADWWKLEAAAAGLLQ